MDFLSTLPEKLKDILKKAEIETPQRVLCASQSTLQRYGASTEDFDQLRSAAAKSICKGFITVSDLIENHSSKWRHISFGSESLDTCTGGILTRGITEISGESGTGKTQLLLQLSLMVQLPEAYGGLEKQTVFISTEDPFPSKRASELVEHFNELHPEIKVTNFLENIFVEYILDEDNLMKCVMTRLPAFMETHNIGLIIIDSIAAIYRIETNLVARANKMRKIAHKLLDLIDQYGCAVVCVNQVTTNVDEANELVPCLGLAWSNLVRTRLKVFKTSKIAAYADSNHTTQVRKLEVIYSPVKANNTCEFLITSQGIV